MRLIDSHCHLQDDRILKNVDQIIQDAKTVGVEAFAVCGTSPKDWEIVLQLARRFDAVIPFFGVHPWNVKDLEPTWYDQLNFYLDQCPSGIGEIGLDHAIEMDHDLQESVFIQQLQLAEKRFVPIQIHCRQAWDRMPGLLMKHPVDAGIILHSFSGSVEMVRQFADLNIYYSFSGSITRSGNKRGQRALQAVPIEKILLETDAPDMPMVIDHQVHAEQPNQPENIIYVLEQAAALRNMARQGLSEQVWHNSLKIFQAIGKLPR